MNEKKTKDLIESLHADKWLELSECEALSGIKRRVLKKTVYPEADWSL